MVQQSVKRLLLGYSVNCRLSKLEQTIFEHSKKIDNNYQNIQLDCLKLLHDLCGRGV